MTARSDNYCPPDICLMLRSHCEQLWLISQVVPVLRELERPDSIPGDELGAALAYLEVLWIDASRRAAETEAAFAALIASNGSGDRVLNAEARRYHAAVSAQRDVVSRHVAHRLAIGYPEGEAEPAPEHQHASL